MNDNDSDLERKAAGCGVTILITAAVVIVAIVAAVIFVLVMFGSFLGGL